MFTVQGYRDGVSYLVTVGGPPAETQDGFEAGCAVTDPMTAAWLDEQAGEPWKATPTGPSGVTNLANPESVLGTLLAHTQVTSVDGDAPDLLGPVEPGVVY
jgi:hypothetical protein